MLRVRQAALVAMMSILSLTGGAGHAQTLGETLIRAYQQSPILEAARASLRAQDESVAQARAGKRPSVSARGSASAGISSDTSGVNDSYSLGLDSSVTLYDSGLTKAAIEGAKAGIAATRANLRSQEQAVMFDAVSAFMDVRRDEQSVSVGENNVRVLREQVRAARDRFELGEITRTDVSLAEARLASAQGSLAAFQGALMISREQYRAVVGTKPGRLQAPPPLPALPGTLAQAEAIAMRDHPSLLAARFSQTQAEFGLVQARAGLKPTVDLSGGISLDRAPTMGGGDDNTASAQARLQGTIPLYAGGRLSSAVRQAEQTVAARKYDVQNSARLIRQNVAGAWSNMEVARALIQANRLEVEAAQVAFEGVREEATLGARTTLDVLDREQELRAAQLNLVTSQRDAYVAAYGVLNAIGLLSVEHLGLGIPAYNPDINYNRVESGPYSTVRGGIVDKLRDRYGN